MSGPIAETRAGRVEGFIEEGVSVFKGIPYAAPPTGAHRFMPPATLAPWTGVRPALEFGDSCIQPQQRPSGWSHEVSESEDCLYLNVWTPAADNARRPVMVWFHGGGFSIGSGSWPIYDGGALARRGDVVVVTVNHRLGIFGYLHLAQIAPDFATSGNAGMLDLVASLEWVRDNIAAFGGDPSNVMIFGESGGGAKVSTLLAMPAARGLFHRAAVQSGPGLRVRTADFAAGAAEKTIADLGVGADAAALQALPAARLAEAQSKGGRRTMLDYSPVLDGVAVTANPRDALADGTAADVPVIIGCNRDEATLFLAADPAVADPSKLEGEGLLRRLEILGGAAPHIVNAYRQARRDASPRDLLLAIESDRMMRIPSIEFAERKNRGSTTPVFMYLFTWASGPLGSAHGFEIPFVFDNARPPMMKGSASRSVLASQMSEAWLAFARSGDPNHARLAAWPAYTAEQRSTMIFDRGDCHVENDPFSQERRAWDGTPVPTGVR